MKENKNKIEKKKKREAEGTKFNGRNSENG